MSIRLEKVHKIYGSGEIKTTALESIDLDITKGEELTHYLEW